MRLFTLAVAVLFGAAALSAESAGGVRWAAPAGWEAQPPRAMIATSYVVPAAAGDTAPGECAVFYFGPGQGGTVDDNIFRWRGQVLGEDGKPAPAKMGKQQVSGLTIHRIDASGTYTGLGGPMPFNARTAPGYRLLGAIIEGPDGNKLFVKFTAPANTAGANEKKFEELLSSFQIDK
jgi:hypothetical protein